MHRHTETGIRRRSRRFGRVATALGLLTTAACTSGHTASMPPSLSPEAKADTVSVATWNMCGVEQWGCEDKGSPNDKFQQLRALADARGVRVMLLQEVCSEDLLSAARRLGKDWHSQFDPYVSVDEAGRSEPVSCTGEGRGQAGSGLLAASPLTEVKAVPTQQPTAGLHRRFLCAQVPAQGVRVCNGHVALRGTDTVHPDWDFRDDQLRSLFEAASEDDRTIIGGDFNSAPPVGGSPTSWLWPAEAYTTYQECDQKGVSRAGRRTHEDGTKIDYLFTTLPRTACQVVDTKASDHRALVMRVSRPAAEVSTS
ncbi:endonuclease/exonuclease/phosphatase family protein [Streptomyces sp. ISL-44]|uniref:endonuclease/exonuclease/phosphatase family protein n=1 Tax=unclassified Streptomyces TaxID=2593676 RepID=UPI001BE6A61F|nr:MULTISPECIES: endonuclease/exonuclease/phosphatase family protein [unclassified Streptomyces]MBT2544283.1 endonuclease/exonuclease/phosphatase family protein [Streptomyces sp. ISL-44]MCX5015573.1 endonuclease/exonuclease/phosphatase family protein [Streptomyces sp. NBC_00555]MCX5609790.1 endonuclease/exonuclease/phosphatase family protein [Streptomyces sp. NBC_00047]UUU43689.1 endonuclease/exonuclease/phosphatase family protein [Streptomyces sp. NBC_00162]